MNALYQYEKNGVLTSEVVESAWNTVLQLPIHDANYLVLAEHFQAELWTADRKLLNRVGDEFTWIQLIA